MNGYVNLIAKRETYETPRGDLMVMTWDDMTFFLSDHRFES